MAIKGTSFLYSDLGWATRHAARYKKQIKKNFAELVSSALLNLSFFIATTWMMFMDSQTRATNFPARGLPIAVRRSGIVYTLIACAVLIITSAFQSIVWRILPAWV